MHSGSALFRTCARCAFAALLFACAASYGAAAPAPQTPAWILQISPTGEATTLSQIRIRFQDDLIPLQALESPDERSKLTQFSLAPALPGAFRFLTPRMVGFQMDRALPLATRVRVTLHAGLADLHGHHLDRDVSWAFETAPISISGLPDGSSVSGLNPDVTITSNVELDLGSLRAQTSLQPKSGGSAVPLAIQPKKLPEIIPLLEGDGSPEVTFDQSTRQWAYEIKTLRSLAKATTYALTIAPGVRPAHGNLPSASAFVGAIKTYQPLAFTGLNRIDEFGRFVGGTRQLAFNNGLKAASARANITITPAPKTPDTWLLIEDGSNSPSIDAGALDPDTTYTLAISSNLTDVYGQALGKDLTASFRTSDLTPDFWTSENLHIIPAGMQFGLTIEALNLPRGGYAAAYRRMEPQDLVYVDQAPSQMYLPAFRQPMQVLPGPSTWSFHRLSARANQPAVEQMPVAQQLGSSTGLLAYGMQAKTYPNSDTHELLESTYYGFAQITNLAVFEQWFPDAGFVRVHHLSDGSAAAGASVDVYVSRLGATDRPVPAPCARGVTDASGTFALSAADVRACVQDRSFQNGAPVLLAVAREGSDWAYARNQDYTYAPGLNSGWEMGSPVSCGLVFSDRNLYQPGESGWFTTEAYFLENGVIHQDRNARYRVTLTDPNGATIDEGVHATNDFGTFAFELALKRDAPVGQYGLAAKSSDGVEVDGGFTVAQFKAPNFKVTLALDHDLVVAGSSVRATGSSEYLFGYPVDGGTSTFYVRRSQTYFAPNGWDSYSFGRVWEWPEQPPSVSSDVVKSAKKLGRDGSARQQIAVAHDLPFPMAYEVDLETTDASNLSVAATAAFTALPSDALIGLSADWSATEGKPFPVKVVVTNPHGLALAGRRVTVALQAKIYGDNRVSYKTVAAADVTSLTQPQSISLTAPGAGPYRIRANFAGARSDVTATDLDIWITGDEPVEWGNQNPDQVGVKLDKASYSPGDTATALIQSPYPRAEIYFAVIRRNVLYEKILSSSGGAVEVRFLVTEDMLPNAAVEAVVTRQGAPIASLPAGSLKSLGRAGFAALLVKLDEKRLKLRIDPLQPKLRPGSEQTVRFTLTDRSGRPVRGQLTVMVADDAILQLTGYREPDVAASVYAQQDISTRFADNLDAVLLAPVPSGLGQRRNIRMYAATAAAPLGASYVPPPGAKVSAKAKPPRVRTVFLPLAYFNGSMITDANGNAQVTFKVPDNLTTWRVMAVATAATDSASGSGFRFGDGDLTFVTTQPLVTNPLLPQFARPGDRFEGGLSVTNNTGASGLLSISGQLGGPLAFEIGAKRTPNNALHRQIGAGSSAYRFSMLAGPAVLGKTGNSSVKFTSLVGDAGDAFQVPLEIEPLAFTEQVIESGATRTRAVIALNVDPHVDDGAGGLDVSIASTLLPEIIAPAKACLDPEYDAFPFLEPLASRLMVSSDLQVLSQRYQHAFADLDLSAHASSELDALSKLQVADGGFAYWPGSFRSDPWLSPYAAQALGQATAAGFTAAPAMTSRLTSYLARVLADPRAFIEDCNRGCQDYARLQALLGLAALGSPRSDFFDELYGRRDEFDLNGKFEFARLLLRFPAWRARGAELADKLQEQFYETGRYAVINLPQRWWWFDSSTATQAQALRLEVARGAPVEVLDRMLTSLLAKRRNGTWLTTYDNAQALNALIDYAGSEPEPPSFQAAVSLAGNQILAAQFAGYRDVTRDLSLPMSSLPKKRSDVALQKSGTGTLHYLVAFSYRLRGPTAGVLAGLRVTRQIRIANQQAVVAEMGLRLQTRPVQLGVGRVFDVGLQIVADHPVDHVFITDPLPAGLEAVDTSFQTSTQYYAAQGDSWAIDYQSIYRDRIAAYADHLGPGVYELHYLVRSVTPGLFSWPGAQARLQYAPEEFGRTASSMLSITER